MTLAEKIDMWQMDFLDPGKLAWFARDRGIESFSGAHISQLWQLRLLKADIVISTRKLRLKGLIEVDTDENGRHIYADERGPLRRKKGWGSVAANLKSVPPYIQLYFHPFRYYVLYHINRILRINIHPMQMLWSIERYPETLKIVLSWFKRWSSKPEASDKIQRLNNVTNLVVATEPCMYERLFNSLRYSPPFVDFQTQRKRIAKHWDEIKEHYWSIGIDEIENIRKQLCIDAETLDLNRNVHMLLRLMKGSARLKIKGSIGGSVHILTMAEMLRRASEKAFDATLPEEDELGFGWYPPDLKKQIYGSNRILDGHRSLANEYLRQYGLDYGVRVRCYVEGDTEYFALDSILERFTAIELINLKGIVVQRRGRGVAFRDNLRIDLKSKIFGLVIIDGDNDDYIRALYKAAEADEICGMYFISEPDFEFTNFSLPELEEIIWEILLEIDTDNRDVNRIFREELHEAISGSKSGKELLKMVKNVFPKLNHVDKGGLWGTKLMDFALKNPELKDEGGKVSKKRPIVEAVRVATQSVSANYHSTRSSYRVDKDSGRLVKRQPRIK